MFPTAFKEENGVLNPPAGMSLDECTPLSIWRGEVETGSNVVISCWKPTKEELDEIIKTGRVWLIIWGQTMPPAVVGGISPFERAKSDDSGKAGSELS